MISILLPLVLTAVQPLAPLPAAQDTQADPEQAEPAWTGSVTAGISLTDGNTDLQRASATADAIKDLGHERYTLGFAWNFTEQDGVVTQRKTFGKAQYDRFIDEKLYWLANVSLEADSQADLDLRTIIGAGLGYQFYDNEEFKLSGEAGLSHFDEDFKESKDDSYVAARLAAKWDWNYSEAWIFGQTVDVLPSLEESDDVYAKLDTRAKATLTDNMFAQFQWIMDWDNTPAEGKERADHLYLVTIGWTF